jgi:spore coat protein CotH
MRVVTRQMQRRELIKFLCAGASLPALAQTTPTAADLFQSERLHEINLEMDPGDWATLRERYQLNDWYWCRINWNGVSAKAAMRSRGNGSRNPLKPGLRISFKRSTDSGPFLGLETLVLNNMLQDSTLTKNALAYPLFAKMGLPAPRISHARVSINGEFWGLYQVVEEVELPYVLHRLGENNGHLYEYSWVDYYYFEQRGEGRDSDYTPEPFELKNNTRNPNPAPLVGLVDCINQASDEAFWTELSHYGDPKQWLTYLAVESMIDDHDGLLGDWGMNGFYLYNYARSTAFALLPWDKDWSFFRWDRPLADGAERNVLMRRLLRTPEGREFFRSEITRVTALAGNAGGWMETEARRVQALTWKSALEDRRRIEGTGPIAEAQAKLIEFTQRRADSLRRQL